MTTLFPENEGKISLKQIRRRMRKFSKITCKLCKKQFSPCDIEIHHLNRNRHDNTKSNLVPLCLWCHATIHDKSVHMKGRYNHIIAPDYIEKTPMKEGFNFDDESSIRWPYE